jgi:hypothetical protein
MTFLAQPKNYTRIRFKEFVGSLNWVLWHPKFIVLHNTAGPTLAQWLEDHGDVGHERRLENIDKMYRNRHWHSGVHLFIGPEDDGIWNPCSLTANGVHASCYNSESLGIEMVGNFATRDEFYSGAPAADEWSGPDGRKVRDNTVFALAVLHKHLGIDPETLHFHRDCVMDHHQCPGGQVSKIDMVARVKTCIETLK